MEALYILGLGELVLLFIAYKLSDKDLLNPSTTFTLMLSVAIILAILYHSNWKAVTTYNWGACFIILSGSTIIIAVDHFQEKLKKRKSVLYYNSGRKFIKIPNLNFLVIICIDLVIVALFYRFASELVEKYNAMDLYGVTSVSSAYRSLYGHDTIVKEADQMKSFLRYGIYILQMSAYVYLYPFVNNVFIVGCSVRKNIKYLLPSLLFLLYGIMCGSRADMIKISISGFTMFYILYMKNRGWKISNLKKIFKIGIKIALLILVLFFLMSVLVGRSAIGAKILDSFVMQIAGYFGAPIVHFSQYMYEPVNSAVRGEECFTSLFIFLHNHGLSGVVRTSHLEYRRLTGGITGNVYTFFRRPLSDFGILGMYIFIVLVIWFISRLYYCNIKYAQYKSRDKFGIFVIIYSILFQWIVYAPIDQISGEFVAVSFVIKLILLVIIYIFSVCFDSKTYRIRLE